MTEPAWEEICSLLDTAHDMQERSYCPYSGFAVGAALLTEDGKVYGGCNIENSAYSPSNCAERTAFFTALADGERKFRAIAIVGGRNREVGDYCFPCGVCRQVMSEFCRPDDFWIITANNAGETVVRTLRDLLPEAFRFKKLKK